MTNSEGPPQPRPFSEAALTPSLADEGHKTLQPKKSSVAATGIPSITLDLAGRCGRRMSHAMVKTVRPLQITSTAIANSAMGSCESVGTSSSLSAARPSYTGPAPS